MHGWNRYLTLLFSLIIRQLWNTAATSQIVTTASQPVSHRSVCGVRKSQKSRRTFWVTLNPNPNPMKIMPEEQINNQTQRQEKPSKYLPGMKNYFSNSKEMNFVIVKSSLTVRVENLKNWTLYWSKKSVRNIEI